MKIQLSSGLGPKECRLAVAKLFDSLSKEYKDIKFISGRTDGNDCYSSVIFETENDLSALEGTIEWICKSPYRPHHKRKNWFVDVSIIRDEDTIDESGEIKFERFHCGGNGGQNVNKVETGVRLIHIPTGITVTSTEERNQLQNRRKALDKLNKRLEEINYKIESKNKNNAWREHTKIVRGNPVRIYEGMNFARKI